MMASSEGCSSVREGAYRTAHRSQMAALQSGFDGMGVHLVGRRRGNETAHMKRLKALCRKREQQSSGTTLVIKWRGAGQEGGEEKEWRNMMGVGRQL